MKNLVMGVATNYGWDVLEPFVTSCKRNCSDAELVLFVDNISDFTRAQLISHGVTLVDIPAEYKEILAVNSRFKMYADFLEIHGDDFAQVFLSDTRDVIFQDDVFAKFSGLTNWLGCVTEADFIGRSKVNYDWLAECFGEEEAQRLADQKIICAGTIIGTVNEMKIFCRTMWEAVKSNPDKNFDQATMNYLARHGLLPIENLFEIAAGDGEIFTMELAENFSVRGNKILRGDGGIPAVVHQYDRKENLIWLVEKNYHAKNFQVDARFTDIRSTIEQATSLLHAGKIDEAAQLFIGKFLVTTDFNDCAKALLRLWEIAMRQPFSKKIGDIELAVQSALQFVNPLLTHALKRICTLLKLSHDGQHSVDENFKNLLINALLKAAQKSLAANDNEQYRACVELLKILGVDKIS